jgi:hypothetical protein
MCATRQTPRHAARYDSSGSTIDAGLEVRHEHDRHHRHRDRQTARCARFRRLELTRDPSGRFLLDVDVDTLHGALRPRGDGDERWLLQLSLYYGYVPYRGRR